jgi:hypothetical protein
MEGEPPLIPPEYRGEYLRKTLAKILANSPLYSGGTQGGLTSIQS